jgi:uncharacterized protein
VSKDAMIFETIVTSVDEAGNPHATPFGVKHEGAGDDMRIVISPFKPSTSLNNILATKCAVLNLTDDVRVFAGALTKRQPWQLVEANQVKGFRLADCLAHVELALVDVRDDATRPALVMKKVAEFNHKPFAGFNRAQAAVVELAVLASRLYLLPREKVQTELQYLQIAIDKTAGEREIEAWTWLNEKINNFYTEQTGDNLA